MSNRRLRGKRRAHAPASAKAGPVTITRTDGTVTIEPPLNRAQLDELFGYPVDRRPRDLVNGMKPCTRCGAQIRFAKRDGKWRPIEATATLGADGASHSGDHSCTAHRGNRLDEQRRSRGWA